MLTELHRGTLAGVDVCVCRKSILSEEPKLSGSNWEGISDQAKDFIKTILVKCVSSGL